ncbi:hypothetical protein VTG60DRAFT_561 [Thermothelomyces hinnuleus]
MNPPGRNHLHCLLGPGVWKQQPQGERSESSLPRFHFSLFSTTVDFLPNATAKSLRATRAPSPEGFDGGLSSIDRLQMLPANPVPAGRKRSHRTSEDVAPSRPRRRQVMDYSSVCMGTAWMATWNKVAPEVPGIAFASTLTRSLFSTAVAA